MNGNTGYGFAILGFYHPGDEVKPGQYQVKFAITNEKTTFFGDAKKKSAFFRVTAIDRTTGRNLLGDEKLWWGRWRYESSDIAICEVRSMGAEARSWLEQGIKMSYYPAGVSGEGYLHFRYLAADTLFDWLKHGEATVGKTIRKASNWSARANGNFEQVTVSAGSFPETLRSDLQFSFSGHTESEIEETLYFAHSRGLIKWTQSEQGTPVWTAELASFDVGQK